MRAPSVGVNFHVVGLQAFSGASLFNQNLAAWNVVRVTSMSFMFDSTALSGCNQNKLYAAWGTTLRAAYPTFVAAPCVVVSSFAPMNLQLSSAGTVTISGLGFSSIDPSPSAYLSGQPCRTTTWTTATQLVCAAPSPVPATGAWRTRLFRPSRGLLTTVGSCRCSTRDVGQGCRNHHVRGLHLRRCATTVSMVRTCIRVGFFERWVLFAALVVSTAAANAAPSGSGTVTISGLSFGISSPTPTATLAAADVCGSSAWTSATTVACAPQAYGGTAVRTALSVSGVAGTLTGQLSFDGSMRRCAAALLRPMSCGMRPVQRRW
jgi:hypothetical protein